ncbi:hypothetical protein K3495_g9110 [Podosphaera aphanis]|nr:hypothetical protein K3495_g9110 [Podosphaera aphanis]
MRLHSKSTKAPDGRISTKLVLSYVLDWVIIITAAVFGAWFAHMPPNKRPFSLQNPEIGFPFQNHEKVPTMMLGVYALAIPACLIYIISMLLVPGPTVSKSTPKDLIWSRKLWEWHAGWLGLFLSLSSAFLITSGMKNLFGKPRPDLLSRCDPDIANLNKYKLGGFLGTDVVSAAICRQKNLHILDDGFRSYPSGHSSFAAGGLIYLSLFLASKLAITIPYLSPIPSSVYKNRHLAFPSRHGKTGSKKLEIAVIQRDGESVYRSSGHNDAIISARNEAAGPPIYLLIFAIIPFFSSIYISSTRYSDFRHHGFDILFGYSIGAISAIFSFRWYHLPISQGAGWAWGPRSRDRSFWAGVGVGNYAGVDAEHADEIEVKLEATQQDDLEAGTKKIHSKAGNSVSEHLELLPLKPRRCSTASDNLSIKLS